MNKFSWKRNKLDDFVNEKENLETKKNKNVNDIKDDSKINKDNISDNIISNEKIVELSKNCSIPRFDDDDYNYIKLIGEGAYGKIYLVEDKITKDEYALKKVLCTNYEELLKFKKEFELIYSLQNPNILRIYKLQIKKLDLTTGCLYVLMERAQTDWNIEIKRRKLAKKFYKENEIISILKQLSQGLFFLQKNKIAHRDIKPQNILIFPNNVYKIADMGEAKEINKNRMQMATLRGSELFMSPLLYEGLKYNKKNIRHNPYKSDMFSLGLCFLYAICLNLKILEYIREMKSMNSIKNILAKFLDKNKYSDKLIEIIYKMIDLEEINRFDFEELEKELSKL
jgi:serine/threonine protein kinase